MTDQAAASRRATTAARAGGIAYVVTGVGHLIVASLLKSTGEVLAVERQMEATHFPMTPRHSMADLMQGFSVAMAILLIAAGVSVLLRTRRGGTGDRAQLGVMLALSLALLVTAVLLLPAPPIVTMTFASIAFAVALGASPRSAPAMGDKRPADASPASIGA